MKLFCHFFLKVYFYVCVFFSVCTGIPGHQNSVSDPLELEIQVIMNLLTWVLKTET